QIKAIFDKWELDCEVIGEVTQSGDMELFWEEEKIAHIPIAPITENAPVLQLPTKEPAYIAQARAKNPLESLQHHTAAHSLTDITRILLGSIDICDKEWIYSQYDSSVQTNTLIAAGQGDGSVVRIKENGAALGAAIHAPVRYCYLNPKEGAKIAVARAGRKCATRGIKPLAISDCLNFGNPNNPEVMWQFKESCEGIKEACEVLQTPVVSGNVSLYNQTDSTDIYPTPTIVSVGLASDPQGVIDSAFTKEGSKIALLGEIGEDFGGSVLEKLAQMGAFGGHLGGEIVPSGDSPQIDLAQEKRLWGLLLEGIGSRLILSAKEVGEGGLGIALAKMSILSRLGCAAQISLPKREMLFSQTQSCVVVETSDFAQLQELAKLHSFPCTLLGEVLGGDSINIQVDSSGRDSVLGSHSADFRDLEATADLKSSSAPKSLKNYESTTATPRILEKDNQAECKKSAQTQKVDSSTASSNQQADNPQAIHLSIQEAGEIFFQSFASSIARGL
ncbi:AIR synthase related protein, partial [Helicobacter sp.]|uniref:AIR synthase related protein n=1 Tax=Helicobacter sp. TaxID=218 RepID=UPI00388F9A81